jgi:hypothetical protein
MITEHYTIYNGYVTTKVNGPKDKRGRKIGINLSEIGRMFGIDRGGQYPPRVFVIFYVPRSGRTIELFRARFHPNKNGYYPENNPYFPEGYDLISTYDALITTYGYDDETHPR